MKRLVVFLSMAAAFPAISFAKGGDWEIRSAHYHVPVPPELEAYAGFQLNEFKTREAYGRMEIEYDLPRELTGDHVSISAEGKISDNPILTGPHCEMKCQGKICEVNYPGVKPDPETVRAYLQSRGIEGNELDARMRVFTMFLGGSPEGVITFN